MKQISILLAFMLAWISPTWGRTISHGHHHNVTHVHAVSLPSNPNDCMMDMLIHESRKSTIGHRARVELSRLILARTHRKSFGTNVCQVVHQKTIVNHKIVCQFTWTCTRPKVGKIDVEITSDMRKAISDALDMNRREGDLQALYFTSNGTCPVPSRRHYRLAPFTFCVPARDV